MDRTGKIGVALAIITLVVWQIFYSKEMERTRLAQEQAAAAAVASGETWPQHPGRPRWSREPLRRRRLDPRLQQRLQRW